MKLSYYHLIPQRNPDWESIFEFHFDRKLRQYWFFHVYDEDSLALDDTVGKVWVNVADFMDKNQVVHANLDKGGYLTVRGDIVKPKTPLGILPFPRGTPNSKKLRFIVTSRGLDSNLNNHETLIITSTEGVNGAEKNVGKSVAITASLNPGWKQVFTLNWNKNKDQRLHFKIYDGKGHKLDDIDKTGDAWIEVNDYVAKGESFTVLLPTKGKLTMTKV
ncbi:unnamed protein product [Orchesella dallaii]|uniref:C2 domain-containing protein n=1 Tax=Orchesella dallaii TaxID=48710 RepID=A0ABP1Q8B9_9HEXA